MRSPRILWVVVADGEHARILKPGKRPGRYRTEQQIDSVAAHKRASQLGSDQPGRAFESASALRHAVELRTDPHEMAKHRFLAEVARVINEAAAQSVFDRLVLVAPIHALHDLRQALSPASAEQLVGMLQKDLVKTPDPEIGEHLTRDVLHSIAPR